MSLKSFIAMTLTYTFASAVVGCTGALPVSSPASGKVVASDSTNNTQISGKSSDQSSEQMPSDGAPEAAGISSAGAAAGAGIDGDAGLVGAAGMGEAAGMGGAAALPTLRWLSIGDFGLGELSTVPDCTAGSNIQRSPCMGENTRCKSSFATTCEAGDCRRLFKCVTGQTNSLIWFPMGDGHTTAATLLPICASNLNIAASACAVANDRCLSSFCTSGSGDGCGRRLFKCLTSGMEGKFYYRWMGDKPLGELTGISQCAATSDIAGSQCFGENTQCVSQFFTDAANSRRRLFKCTP
jgi:hypothetical protein